MRPWSRHTAPHSQVLLESMPPVAPRFAPEPARVDTAPPLSRQIQDEKRLADPVASLSNTLGSSGGEDSVSAPFDGGCHLGFRATAILGDLTSVGA